MSEATELLFHMHEETEEEAYQPDYLEMLEERRAQIIKKVNSFFVPIGEHGVMSIHDSSLPQNWYRVLKFFTRPFISEQSSRLICKGSLPIFDQCNG